MTPRRNRLNPETANGELDAGSTCAICTGEVGTDDRAVTCDGCEKWVHIACGKISAKLYNKIKDAPTDNPITWYCLPCSKSKKNDNNAVNDTQKTELDRTKENLREANAKNDSLNKIINNLQQDLENANRMLINSKRENIRINQELIDQTNLVNRLNGELQDYRGTNLAKIVTNKGEGNETISNPGLGLPAKENIQKEGIPNKYCDVEQETSLEDTENHDPDILIIGDSLLRGIAEFSDDPKIEIKSAPGAYIQDLSKYLSARTTMPNTVIIHIGTNNIKYAATPNHLMRPLWLTIESAKKKFKNTLWIVNGIIHRRDIQDRSIREANEALAFMCDQLKVVFRDPNEVITDRSLARDGLHLNRYGSRLLAKFIIDDVRPRQTYHKTPIEINASESNENQP